MAGIKFDKGMEGMRRISLHDLRVDLFPNSRDEARPDHRLAVEELRESISGEQGLLHPLTLGVLPDGKEALMAGFTRRLAILQIAVTHIFNAINKENGFTKKSDPGYLNVAEPEHRKKVQELRPQEWEKAMKETYIPVVVKNVEDAQSARAVNVLENIQRTNFSPLELTRAIVDMLSGPNAIKATTLASKMGVSGGKISQWKKVGELPVYLRSKLATPEEGEVFTEQELADLRNTVKACVDDFTERLGKTDDPQAIGFTLARAFSFKVMTSDKKVPMPRKLALRALQWMLGWSFNSNTLPDNRQTPDMSVWEQHVEADAKMYKAELDAANAPTAEEQANATPVGDAAGTAVPATAVAGSDVPETPVAESGATANAAAAAAAANTEAGSEAGTTAPAAPAGTASTETVDTVNAPPSGAPRQTKAGQQMPAGSKYAKAFNCEAMEALADFNFKTASDEDLRFGESIGYLYAASAGCQCLGLKEKQEAIDVMVDELVSEVDEYVSQLEQIALAAFKAKLTVKGVDYADVLDQKSGQMMRPFLDSSEEDDGTEVEEEVTQENVTQAATA